MGDREVFFFGYENFEFENFRPIARNVLSAAIRVGFKPKDFGVYESSKLRKGTWKGINNFMAAAEGKYEATQDASIAINGTLAGYNISISFGFPAQGYRDIEELNGVLLFVKSYDERWPRASYKDKIKLRSLLKSISAKI